MKHVFVFVCKRQICRLPIMCKAIMMRKRKPIKKVERLENQAAVSHRHQDIPHIYHIWGY